MKSIALQNGLQTGGIATCFLFPLLPSNQFDTVKCKQFPANFYGIL